MSSLIVCGILYKSQESESQESQAVHSNVPLLVAASVKFILEVKLYYCSLVSFVHSQPCLLEITLTASCYVSILSYTLFACISF